MKRWLDPKSNAAVISGSSSAVWVMSVACAPGSASTRTSVEHRSRRVHRAVQQFDDDDRIPLGPVDDQRRVERVGRLLGQELPEALQSHRPRHPVGPLGEVDGFAHRLVQRQPGGAGLGPRLQSTRSEGLDEQDFERGRRRGRSRSRCRLATGVATGVASWAAAPVLTWVAMTSASTTETTGQTGVNIIVSSLGRPGPLHPQCAISVRRARSGVKAQLSAPGTPASSSWPTTTEAPEGQQRTEPGPGTGRRPTTRCRGDLPVVHRDDRDATGGLARWHLARAADAGLERRVLTTLEHSLSLPQRMPGKS